jgi:hypothetical protein
MPDAVRQEVRVTGASDLRDAGFSGSLSARLRLVSMPRTIVIGDVHGCADELDELLDRVAFTRGDRVVFVGDLVARGPDSLRVLHTVRRIGALAAMGNHEHRLASARAAMRLGTELPWLASYHEELLRNLDADDWAFIEAMPLYVELEEHRLRVVHAGLVPGVPISEQRSEDLTKMRSVRADGTPSKDRGHTLWGSLYRGPPHVAFGHNALDGLQLYADATGLDTACVYGGALTALVLAEGQAPPPPAERRALLTSVPARRRYYEPGLERP